jgi:predicted metalloprotease with PDZ domain
MTAPLVTLIHDEPRRRARHHLIMAAMALGLLAVAMALTPRLAAAQVGVGPVAAAAPPALPIPQDKAFNGRMTLAVDATDTDHQVFSVHETIPVRQSRDTVLLYPQWETGSHAPTASVAELAGLVVHVDGKRCAWRRDAVDMHAFHIAVPDGARSITLDFQFLASARDNLLRPDMVEVPWQRVLLYPAGWYVRDIPVLATLKLPDGLRAFTSLALERSGAGVLTFAPVTLEQLVDAPVYAGRYTRQIPLTAGKTKPVRLDLLADQPADLAMTPADVSRLQALVAQTLEVFGPGPYRHYDVIVSLSDMLNPGGGIEHSEEGENNLPAAYFRDTGQQLNNRDLIAHEFVHAWNGRWRMPADLWSPTFNQPVDGSLLWVYEGQTEFWGRVLAARAGLRDPQQTLDKIALDADVVANRRGRSWKTLQDSTNDAVYMAGHRVAWRDWQRREDYYPEGVLLWLDVDARLRELTGGRRGLDDFARRFFMAGDGPETTRTYTFADVCAALNAVAPNDWSAFLARHLQSHDTADAMAGLARAGWKLTYTDVPTETFRQDEQAAGASNLDDSIGLQIDGQGHVKSVQWDGPAFRAGMSPGARVVEVNGEPFSTRALLDAVDAAASRALRVEFEYGGRKRLVSIPYAGGLRYPHLERIAGTPDRLSPLLLAP